MTNQTESKCEKVLGVHNPNRLGKKFTHRSIGLFIGSSLLAACINNTQSINEPYPTRVLIPTATPAIQEPPTENISAFLENLTLEKLVLRNPLLIEEGIINKRGPVILSVNKDNAVILHYRDVSYDLPEGVNIITTDLSDNSVYFLEIQKQDQPISLFDLSILDTQDASSYTGVLSVLLNLDFQYPNKPWSITTKQIGSEGFELISDVANEGITFEDLATVISENLN